MNASVSCSDTTPAWLPRPVAFNAELACANRTASCGLMPFSNPAAKPALNTSPQPQVQRQADGAAQRQRHRVALARALAPKPDLILLDEPFSALDAELRVRLREDVRKVIAKTGTTAILVTHDQEEALSMASRVAILRDGEFAQIGKPNEIYQAPADVEMATFLGDSVVIDGVVKDDKVVTDLGLLTPLNKVANGAKGRVAIRPENFYLQPNPKGEGEVISRQYFGHDALIEVKLPKLVIRARANGPFAPEIGMKVTVWVRGQVNFYTD